MSSQRIEELIGELSAHASPDVLRRAQELVAAVLELHQGGLARALELLGPDEIQALGADPQVAQLLLLHDLHPLGVRERVAAAVAALDGDLVELVGIDGGHARLRLREEPAGLDRATLEARIEGAIIDAAPELLGVQFEQPLPAGASFVPVSELRRRTQR